jgi:hypothetical protein
MVNIRGQEKLVWRGNQSKVTDESSSKFEMLAGGKRWATIFKSNYLRMCLRCEYLHFFFTFKGIDDLCLENLARIS